MKPDFSQSTIISRNDDVLFQRINEYIVMADILSGMYFSVSGSAKEIWDMLGTPLTVHDICQTLQRNFEVAPEMCERDVVEFLAEMSGAGLVRVVG